MFASGPSHDRPPADEFFIGWLDVPAGYKRRVRQLAWFALLLAPLLAGAIAASQSSPGTAEWNSETRVTLEGMAYCRPYALLRTLDAASDGAVHTVLLVEEGKFGAAERLKTYDGRAVRVRGTYLHRNDRWMLELATAPDAIETCSDLAPSVTTKLAWPSSSSAATVTLRGEIIDPKCFLGAMKPGAGKTHKACATLCISGGIPPMLYTGSTGQPAYHLLVAENGAAINQAILPFVGDLVEVRATHNQCDDLSILRLDPQSVRRVSRLFAEQPAPSKQ
ncbi:MAG: hypothetical protein K1X74_06055 [Pirellulales bacterium]|nr:hypothetical protein [Pirellulales bacterium]